MKLKIVALFIVMITFSCDVHGQELDENTFDFWVGDWELVWANPDGSEVKGSNKIVKILNQKVLQENFKDPNTNFEGTSISVYNPETKT